MSANVVSILRPIPPETIGFGDLARCEYCAFFSEKDGYCHSARQLRRFVGKSDSCQAFENVADRSRPAA